jgi:hypothetical protein
MTPIGPLEILNSGHIYYSFTMSTCGDRKNTFFEWGGSSQWEWWAADLGVSENWGWPTYYTDFPGSTGMYLVVKTGILSSGSGADWSAAIRITEVQWVPAGNLGDPVGSWALKFEINIPQAWNGSTLVIKTENGDYMARYEPWQVTATKTVDYSTTGWQTVTIPLSSFRKMVATLELGKEPRLEIESLTQILY